MLTAIKTPKEALHFINRDSHEEFTSSFVSFCEKMGSVFEIKDFLLTLKAQTPKKFKTGELLLFYKSEMLGLRRAYIKKGLFYEESAKKPWPDTENISLNNEKQNLYLIREFGKPFSKTLVIPLLMKSGRLQQTASLFVEMSEWKKELNPLTDFFQRRHLILNLTFQRAFLNTNFNRVSYLWSQLFLHWAEPLAILQNFQLIRANHSFKEIFSTTAPFLKEKQFSGLYESGGKSYQLHYHPISQFKSFKEIGVLYCQDMTKPLHLKEQLFQTEKMLSLCELGKDMAHQLNNPLTGLRAMTQILYRTPEMKEFKTELAEIEKATERSQKIIENLLSFSQPPGAEKSCNLNQAVQNSLSLLKSMTKGIHTSLELYKEPLEIKGELSVLQQITYNLILNSCQALKENQRGRKALIQIQTKKISKNTVCLKIKDNGPGIPKENMEKIFQALWTSKSKKEGTGLGLGISRQLVRKLGGDIFVSSREDKWTCFTVLLPIPVTNKSS